jgi:hypothetical protein
MAKKSNSPFELKIPMLSLAMSSHHKAKPMAEKSLDEGSELEGRKRKSIEKNQPQKEFRGHGLTAGMEPHWNHNKESHKNLLKEGIQRELRTSTHDWVAGRKSTAEHKKTVTRAKHAMGFKT